MGDTTTSSYDPEGHLTSFTDANGHTWTYAYDALGDLTSATNPWATSPPTPTTPRAT
ncbi:MAG: RHS repeat protein [Thermaerobacter sp.]|nr:RHS repeat protein [Thermaerobacter sp.]